MTAKVNECLQTISIANNSPPDPCQEAGELLALSLVQEGLDAVITALESPTSNADDEFSIHASDIFQFGYLWPVIRELAAQGRLLDYILDRKVGLQEQKKHWEERIEAFKEAEGKGYFLAIEKMVQEGKLVRSREGAGAAYILSDAKGHPRFVVKPVDEDILCLNNAKNLASPFNEKNFRVRDDVPLYRSAQTDVACYLFAKAMGMPEITPKTVMDILSSNKFYDLSDILEPKEKEQILLVIGKPDREKLCSVQEFIPHSKSLHEVYQDALDKNNTDEEIETLFDQGDFENVNIFIWTTYDNDNHAGNIRVYLKGFSPAGKPIYRMKKIDNGLSFPEKNTFLVNFLPNLPNGQHPLSEEARKKIANLPISEMAAILQTYEMESSIAPFYERMEVLQELAKRKNMTIYEIDLRMRALSLPDGKKLALSSISQKELEDIIYGDEETSAVPNQIEARE